MYSGLLGQTQTQIHRLTIIVTYRLSRHEVQSNGILKKYDSIYTKQSHALNILVCLFIVYQTDPVYRGLFYKHLRHSLVHEVNEQPFPPNLRNIIITKP